MSDGCRCVWPLCSSECICAVGHIKRTDGFLGLYRGLTPRLFSAVISTVVANAINTVSTTEHCDYWMYFVFANDAVFSLVWLLNVWQNRCGWTFPKSLKRIGLGTRNSWLHFWRDVVLNPHPELFTNAIRTPMLYWHLLFITSILS